MQSENQQNLGRVEYETVISNLKSGNIPLTISLQKKDKTTFANELFPVVISPSQYFIDSQKFIHIKKSAQDVRIFLNRPLKVEFYFNKRGLYFNSLIFENQDTFSLELSNEIFRIEDSKKSVKRGVRGTLSSLSSKFDVRYECVLPAEDYHVFSKPQIEHIPLEFRNEVKALLARFVSDAKEKKSPPVGNALHLIPLCRYLVTPAAIRTNAVQGRLSPLEIIFVDERRLVLATQNTVNLPRLEEEYNFCFEVEIKPGFHFMRKMNIPCVVENFYTQDEKKCFVCRFTLVKEEDSRFLSEYIKD